MKLNVCGEMPDLRWVVGGSSYFAQLWETKKPQQCIHAGHRTSAGKIILICKHEMIFVVGTVSLQWSIMKLRSIAFVIKLNVLGCGKNTQTRKIVASLLGLSLTGFEAFWVDKWKSGFWIQTNRKSILLQPHYELCILEIIPVLPFFKVLSFCAILHLVADGRQV